MYVIRVISPFEAIVLFENGRNFRFYHGDGLVLELIQDMMRPESLFADEDTVEINLEEVA